MICFVCLILKGNKTVYVLVIGVIYIIQIIVFYVLKLFVMVFIFV